MGINIRGIGKGIEKDEEKKNTGVTSTYMGGKLVEATGAADAAGVPISAVGWNNEEGTVTLGGQTFIPAKTPDGKAYVDADLFSNAIKKYKNSTGIKTGAELIDVYNENADDIDSLSDKLTNRQEWSYNPENDAAYKAYLEAAIREGQKAFEDAIGRYTARTGGMMNSAGLSAATAGYNNYIDELNDKVPELMKNSFDRYVEDYGLTKDAMNVLLERAAQDYEKTRNAAEYAKDMSDYNFERQDKRVKAMLDNQIKRTEAEYAPYMAEAEARLAEQKLNDSLGERQRELDFNISLRDFYIENALNRGYFTQAEAEFLGVDADSSPYDMKNRYFNNVTRKEIETQEMLKNYYKLYYGQ